MSIQPFILRLDQHEPPLNVVGTQVDGVGVERGDAELIEIVRSPRSHSFDPYLLY